MRYNNLLTHTYIYNKISLLLRLQITSLFILMIALQHILIYAYKIKFSLYLCLQITNISLFMLANSNIVNTPPLHIQL